MLAARTPASGETPAELVERDREVAVDAQHFAGWVFAGRKTGWVAWTSPGAIVGSWLRAGDLSAAEDPVMFTEPDNWLA